MFFNRIVAPRSWGGQGDSKRRDKAECEELPPLLAYLEGVIPDSGFLVEDRLTLADIAVACPFVEFPASARSRSIPALIRSSPLMWRRSWPGRASRR